MGTGLIDKKATAIVLVDYQERLMPVISNAEACMKNATILSKASQILGLPLIVTEQYPKGLGHTSSAVELPDGQKITEKMCFSCMLEDDFKKKLKDLKIKTIILAGVETHICVLKTALEALEEGYEVHLAADACSSRTQENKALAIERMKQSGVFVTSTESVLFQMMDFSGNDEFKAISKLIK